MATDQWEYCRLWIANAKAHKKGAILGLGGQSQGWGYDSGVDYIRGSGDVVSETLTNKDEVCALHPFLLTYR